MKFPFVTTHPSTRGWIARATLFLRAIDWEGFHSGAQTPADRFVTRHRATSRLLHAFSRWSVPATLELRLASHPSLDTSVPSAVSLKLHLECRAARQEVALESCLSQFVSLGALLAAFWPHAEWESAGQEFRPECAGFEPLSYVAIVRRSRVVALTRPFLAAGRPLGFETLASASLVETSAAHVFPWVPSWDDGTGLLEALLAYPAPVVVAAQVSNYADPSEAVAALEATVESCELMLSAGSPDQIALTGRIASLRDAALAQAARFGDGALRCRVTLLSPGPPDEGLAAVLGQYITGDASAGAPGGLQGGFDIAPPGAALSMEPPRTAGDVMTGEEAACAFRLPLIFSSENHGLPVRRSRTAPYVARSGGTGESGATLLGVNGHRGVERPIYVQAKHRFKHAVLFGMTGTGKSTLMLSWMLQDLRRGHGLCLIDPHGELADGLLARVPGDRAADVVVVDFADREHPVPLNLIAWRSIEERDLYIDDLLSSLLRVYGDPQIFGPVFETNFRAMMKLLMGDKPERGPSLTLLEFPRLYTSRALRHRLLDDLSDDAVRDFILEFEAVTAGDHRPENLAPYITSKFARFLHDTFLRRIVGHGDMALDFGHIMAGGKVVVVKLARGRFGSAVADLVASQLVSRIRAATLARGAHDDRPFFVYIDEAGSMAHDPAVAQLLSEGRKFHVGMFLAVQYATQLRDPNGSRDLLAAALGNVGTVLAYRVGVEDADLLEPIFGPLFSARDLI